LVKGELVHKLVPEDDEANVVRRVFELRATGLGYRSIADRVHAEAPLRQTRNGKLQPITWNKSSIAYWVACKTYRGTIISEELWDRANAVTNKGFTCRGGIKHAWPLSGAVRCECGRLLVVQPSGANWKRTGKKYIYRHYYCDHPISHDGVRPRFKAETLEAQIPALLKRLRSTRPTKGVYQRRLEQTRTERERELKAAENFLETLQKRKRHVWDLAADGSLPKAQLAQRLEHIESELVETAASIEAAKATIAGLAQTDQHEQTLQGYAGALAERWASVPAQRQRQVALALSRVVGDLIVDEAGVLRPLCDLEQDRLQR
jgi:site-specific DNA recombinase